MNKIVKILSLAVLAIFAGLYGARSALIVHARHKANNIVAAALKDKPNATPDEKIIAITTEVFHHFEHRDPATIFVTKFRPYLGNERLPEFIRFPNGLVATEIQMGYCDGATRMLGFVLRQAGFTSKQWNMVQGDNAHSALAVHMPDGRNVLADPFYGYVTQKDGKLISAYDALVLTKQGVPMKEIFRPLGDKSEPSFYKDYAETTMAAQGDPLEIKAEIPDLDKNAVTFGKVDGSSTDVRGAANKYNMTPFWDYMGHKYNRNYVRELEARKPVKIQMTLTSQAEDGIMIAEPAPAVDGSKLTWNLKAGDEIRFYDGRARVSWRRLNSYIPVDQIVFTPIN